MKLQSVIDIKLTITKPEETYGIELNGLDTEKLFEAFVAFVKKQFKLWLLFVLASIMGQVDSVIKAASIDLVILYAEKKREIETRIRLFFNPPILA